MISPIEQLPSQKLLDHCAVVWGLSNITFVRKMENIVYSCDSDKGKVFVRLTTPLRRARAEIQAEINWIEHLAKSGLRVPRVIQDKSGNKIVSLSEANQHFEAVVFSGLQGDHPSKEIAKDPKFLRTLGRLIAQMHLASQRYEGTHQGVKREDWFDERGLRHALAAAKQSKEYSLRDRLEKSIACMHSLPKVHENYGLVHADLGALNLFVEEDESIGIIDFDDSCYHWFAFDLAIVVFSMASRFDQATPQPEEAKWLKDLVEGYQTIRPLSQEEIDLIPLFIDFACLRLFFWIEHHQLLKTFHEDAIDKVNHLKEWVKGRVSSNS